MFPLLDLQAVPFSEDRFVNRTTRFYIPIPQFEGELLVAPAGQANAGCPLRKNPLARGVVFFNPTDNALQSVLSDGGDGIMVNDVTPAQAQRIEAVLEARYPALLVAPAPEAVRDLLQAVRSAGCNDLFQKREDSVAPGHDPIGKLRRIGNRPIGYLRSNKPTLHRAAQVLRAFSVDGRIPQNFRSGAILLNDDSHIWGIDTMVFVRSFRRVEDGLEKELAIADLERLPLIA